MKIHRYISILLFLTTFSNGTTLSAQNIQHLNLWTRFSVTQPLSEKLRAEAEFQHRTQNNYYASNIPFEESLLNSVRLWGIYKLNRNMQVGLSPFAYFQHSPIIQKYTDVGRPTSHEIRFSAAVDIQHQLARKLYLIDRTCIEYRDFQNADDLVRLHHRFGFRYELNEKISAVLFDELFFNIEGADISHFFDHNRLGLLLSYKPTKHWRIEAGLIHINRLPRNSSTLLTEENVVLHLYYTFNQLKKQHS